MMRKTRRNIREKRPPLHSGMWCAVLCTALCCLACALAVPAWAAEAQSGAQQLYHSPQHLYYQASSHHVAYGPKTFVLIPQENYSENWTPSTTVWSGKTEANYLVAYCSDDRTSSSTQGTAYTTYMLDNSRFTSDVQQRKVAAIIGHSYPFLTAEEMRQTLQRAVTAGELTAEVLDCTESEWIAAAQWAIWSTTATTGQIGVEDVEGAEFPNGHPEKYINPLTDVGHTEEEQIKSHIEALKNWLCSLEEPVRLEVEGYTHRFTEEGGTYTLEVTVQLNRAVTAEEEAAYQLTVGRQSARAQSIGAGQSAFTATLQGIPYEALADAHVQLTITGAHMQAYFYDSENYQDMVGGSWESYERDLSFDLGLEQIDISVAKVWTQDDTDVPAVTVQLFANGTPFGAAVTLTADNNWSYVWRDLYRTDILGREIAYTVQETPLEGYYSRLEQVSAYTQSVTVWEQVSTFAGEGKYLIVSPFGALAATEYTDEAGATKDDYVTLKAVDVSSVSKTPEGAVWEAKASAQEEGAYTLYTPYLNWYMYVGAYGYLSSSPCPLHFADGHLYHLSSSGTKWYFAGFYSDEAFYVSTKEELALDFTLYKLVEKPLPAADISFLLTNTRYDAVPGSETVDITVEKQWSGREDGTYPQSVTVTLLQNGRPYGEAVVLSAENGWRYTWSNMPVQVGEESVAYTITEEQIPNYELSVEERAYFYTLTNIWTGAEDPVPEPEGPTLPQTGGRNWPAPVLAAMGTVLVAAGAVRRRKKHG